MNLIIVSSMICFLNTYVCQDEPVFRIVNGQRAKLGDVPYQVALRRRQPYSSQYKVFCGGTIIATTRVLSAAHCFVDKRKSICDPARGELIGNKLISSMAVASTLTNSGYYSSVDSNQGQWRVIERVRYPKEFKFPKNDICVVYINKPFAFNAYVKSIPIARTYRNYVGSCLASGYGRLSKIVPSEELMLAHLKIMPLSRCNRIHQKNMRNFVCTESGGGSTDVGKGDSGGPLVCSGTGDVEDPTYGVLVGVVSGTRRANFLSPGGSFFTRVTSYRGFISSGDKNSVSYVVIVICVFLDIF